MKPPSLAPALALALAVFAPSEARSVGIGIVGDSLSDEYQSTTYLLDPILGPPPGTAVRYEGFSWVEQLAMLRGVDFGAYEPDPGVRSDSRFDGYAHNWALKGQQALGPTLLEFVSLGVFGGQTFAAQVAGLEAQVAAGDVDVAVVMIGANDVFLRDLTFQSLDPANPSFQAFVASYVTTVVGAVTVLSTAGAGVVVGGLPVLGDAPTAVDAAFAFMNAELAAALPGGVSFVAPYGEADARSTGSGFLVGTELIAWGAAPSELLVSPGDPAAVSPAQCGFEGTLLPGLVVGPEGCPTRAFQRFHNTDDDIHPTTVMQGLLANALLAGINEQLAPADQIAPLSDDEILAVAGLPEPGAALSSACVALALLGVARRRH